MSGIVLGTGDTRVNKLKLLKTEKNPFPNGTLY